MSALDAVEQLCIWIARLSVQVWIADLVLFASFADFEWHIHVKHKDSEDQGDQHPAILAWDKACGGGGGGSGRGWD